MNWIKKLVNLMTPNYILLRQKYEKQYHEVLHDMVSRRILNNDKPFDLRDYERSAIGMKSFFTLWEKHQLKYYSADDQTFTELIISVLHDRDKYNVYPVKYAPNNTHAEELYIERKDEECCDGRVRAKIYTFMPFDRLSGNCYLSEINVEQWDESSNRWIRLNEKSQAACNPYVAMLFAYIVHDSIPRSDPNKRCITDKKLVEAIGHIVGDDDK